MTTGKFTPAEWKQLVNAPQLIRHLVTVADRGAILTKRGETKALKEFVSSYKSQSPLVQSIIAGQKDVDEKVELSAEEAQKALEQLGTALEARTDEAEGDAIRDFLTSAGEAVAKAVREQSLVAGSGASPAEQKALTAIAAALKATETDKRRRHTAAMNAAAMKQVEEQRAKAKAEADAKAKVDAEAKANAAVEAQKKAEEAKAKAMAVAAAQKKAAEDQRKADEQARRLREAQEKAELARQSREASAKQHAEQLAQQREEESKKAEAGKALSEAQALKEKAEAMKREAEAIERQAEAMKAAAQGTEGTAETIYVVKPGDTLSGIAKAVYGKAGRWHEIYEANKDIIKSPNLIRPGWKLRIPR